MIISVISPAVGTQAKLSAFLKSDSLSNGNKVKATFIFFDYLVVIPVILGSDMTDQEEVRWPSRGIKEDFPLIPCFVIFFPIS